jgi:hypothetical protein
MLSRLLESAAKKVADQLLRDKDEALLNATKKTEATDPVHYPKTYQLIDSRTIDSEEKNSSVFSFYVLGCIGEKGEAQKQVAELMNDIATKNGKPKCIIFLGDNFYPRGAISPDDPVFKEQFDLIYQAENLDAIKDIPCFFIAGNHCHNIFRWGGGDRGWSIDYQRIEAQIKHTFRDEDKENPNKVKLYEQDVLDLATLQPWNMPRRFYKLVSGENIELYFLDTNTYVRDYLFSLEDKDSNPNNQAVWLKREMRKNEKAVKLAFHHHARFTVGKRFFYSDADLYLTPSDFKKLDGLGIKGNYNQIIDQILRRERFVFDANYSAHDHSMYYYIDDNVCQVVSGGGGGELQERESFIDSEKVPCFLKQNGFVSVNVNPYADKQCRVMNDIYSVEHHHLQFSNNSTSPYRRAPIEDPLHNQLWRALLIASHQYLNHCKYSMGFFTKVSNTMARKIYLDPSQVNEFINFLNGFEGFMLFEIVHNLNSLFLLEGAGTYKNFIDDAFKSEKIGMTLDAFIAKNTRQVSSSIPIPATQKNKNRNPSLGTFTPSSPVRYNATMYSPYRETITNALANIPDGSTNKQEYKPNQSMNSSSTQ